MRKSPQEDKEKIGRQEKQRENNIEKAKKQDEKHTCKLSTHTYINGRYGIAQVQPWQYLSAGQQDGGGGGGGGMG